MIMSLSATRKNRHKPVSNMASIRIAVAIIVYFSGCCAYTEHRRFLLDNQQSNPLSNTQLDHFTAELANMRLTDATYAKKLTKLRGYIDDLTTHMSRTDADISDLARNRTSCACSTNGGVSIATLLNTEQIYKTFLMKSGRFPANFRCSR